MTTQQQIVIDRRFNGPPNSGNGGYVSGVLARGLSGAAAVTLRSPPPLDRPLDLVCDQGGRRRLLDGERLVGEAQATALDDLEVPPPVSLAEAEAAVQRYRGFKDHTFGTCFVCGPRRDEGDGLRIFPGQVGDRALVAAPWTPDASLADADGLVRSEFVWAALDCPGAFAVYIEYPDIVAVLGRFEVEVLAPVRAGEPHVVTGWPIRHDGRKHVAGTALFDRDGRLLGWARAVWIEIPRTF